MQDSTAPQSLSVAHAANSAGHIFWAQLIGSPGGPQSAGQEPWVSSPVQTPSPQTAGFSSILHSESQPSPLSVLPSSHCSPASMTSLPHTGAGGPSITHAALQPSPSCLLPSSHCSPSSSLPSPHSGPALNSLHALVQASLSTLLPSSHSSLPGSIVPSPHQEVLPGSTVAQSLQPVRPERNRAVSKPPSPASHTTIVRVCSATSDASAMSTARRGVVPSNCVPLSVMTVVPAKNGPLIEMTLPSASSATFLPSMKTPTMSLNCCPTNSGYSSLPTTYSRCSPLRPDFALNFTSSRAAS